MASLDRWVVVLTFAASIGSGLIGGVFFAFSTFVMRALHRLRAREGVAAMQAINVAVINPLFLGAFFGTGLAWAGAVLLAVRSEWPRLVYLMVGGVLYVGGAVLVTMACNVPLNNALATLTPDDADAEQAWDDYVRRWTRWNHVRTIAALAAAGAFILALRR